MFGDEILILIFFFHSSSLKERFQLLLQHCNCLALEEISGAANGSYLIQMNWVHSMVNRSFELAAWAICRKSIFNALPLKSFDGDLRARPEEDEYLLRNADLILQIFLRK